MYALPLIYMYMVNHTEVVEVTRDVTIINQINVSVIKISVFIISII